MEQTLAVREQWSPWRERFGGVDRLYGLPRCQG